MNLYVLTEERPKEEVIKEIIQIFLHDKGYCAFVDSLKIIPIIKNGLFCFYYEILGISCKSIEKIYLKIVSGNSSFVDYLVYFQDKEPNTSDMPLYAIEETKTDDSESRNTGVYQRITKFVYISHFYPNTKKIMLYNIKVKQKEKPTQTSIFGTRILQTLGVEIVGKNFNLNDTSLQPFSDIKEFIESKNVMRKPPKGNVPITIKVCDSEISCDSIPRDTHIYTIPENKEITKIQISARLIKNNHLAHDPNIGALSGICATLRKLGFDKKIEIISHGLEQKHIGNNNKFIQIANLLDISLQGLKIPKIEINKQYWHYETNSEKLATIFIHLAVTYFSKGYGIFENHAGCEKGYFLTPNGEHIALEKYENKEAYKSGDKNAIAFIPDLILLDVEHLEIINIEGKKYDNKAQGLKELQNYDFIEQAYIKKYYPQYTIIRTLVLYGSNEEHIVEIEVGFLLNAKGRMILGIKAPKVFIQSLSNLIAFWNPK
ncbi:hypothetical protein [uncultured Campylobacter sp.]|uniref:hypothetical protein n=1 Tax=uncultured Campylobacter sp. TaxID=218934 RepID=UPI00260B95B0|nr:hypothetical protein [uncultured Campylobacter sp.]